MTTCTHCLYTIQLYKQQRQYYTECRHEFTNKIEMIKHKKFIELVQTKSLRKIKRHYENDTKHVLLFWLVDQQ